MSFAFPYPVVVCDTGGTNVRFALGSEPGRPLGPILHLATHDYPGLPEALDAARPKLGQNPRSMIVCGAGPIAGRTLKLTNAPWLMDGPETAQRGGLDQGLLLNDFEAQALSLPALPAQWVRRIGPLDFQPSSGPQAIIGPGTGLGVAALIEAGGRFTPVSSEACHIDFGPVTPDEYAIWPHLERAHGRVTSESVLSGEGLARVHRARRIAAGAPDPQSDPASVTQAALAGDREAAESVRMYWRIVARFAGDMAVTFVATGGLTLSGGVLPRVIDLLDEAEFRRLFEDKAPVDGLARRIPTRIVVHDEAVLAGMAALAAAPDRYAVDYARRAWVGGG